MGYFGVQLRLELLIRTGGQQAILGAAALATQSKLKLDRRAHGVTTTGRALLLEGFVKKNYFNYYSNEDLLLYIIKNYDFIVLDGTPQMSKYLSIDGGREKYAGIHAWLLVTKRV